MEIRLWCIPMTQLIKFFYRGEKRYELSNHLGNVLAVITDRRIQSCDNGNVMHYEAQVVSISDYYPFGMIIENRKDEREDFKYKFGIHTQEKDDEIYGEGNSYTAEFWQYDSRLGKRWNIDPVFKYYESPYGSFANNPLFYTDPTGADTFVIHRSEPIQKYNDYDSRAIIYKVTFSVIRDGVHRKLPNEMYMISNATKIGLSKTEYSLKWQTMGKYQGFVPPKSHILLLESSKNGQFIHSGSYWNHFQGCLGVTTFEPVYGKGVDGENQIDILESRESLGKIKELYKNADAEGELTGDKFLLYRDSRAKTSYNPIRVIPRPVGNLQVKRVEPPSPSVIKVNSAPGPKPTFGQSVLRALIRTTRKVKK
jgi:hypothetical protein